jgi:hypothetical protein
LVSSDCSWYYSVFTGYLIAHKGKESSQKFKSLNKAFFLILNSYRLVIIFVRNNFAGELMEQKKIKGFHCRLSHSIHAMAAQLAGIYSTSTADVVRGGIKLLKKISEAEAAGGTIYIEMPDGRREKIWILL